MATRHERLNTGQILNNVAQGLIDRNLIPRLPPLQRPIQHLADFANHMVIADKACRFSDQELRTLCQNPFATVSNKSTGNHQIIIHFDRARPT